MKLVKATGVTKSFPNSQIGSGRLKVVDSFTLEVSSGELVTLFGPNGCGKTTILNLFAGLIAPDSGNIQWNATNHQLSGVGYVFQNYADTLLPWRTVRANIAFPLEIRREQKESIDHKVDRVLRLLGIQEHADKKIYELSGGLKQLVAIGRSTIYNPGLLLLDEPFSSLDYSISRTLWGAFREYWSEMQVTTLFVSHNIDEAIFLGDRICVISSRPARIVAELAIPFPSKRDASILKSQQFFEIRSQVLDAFEAGRRV